MAPKLFRKIPPLDLVTTVLHGIGFTGITDTKIFTLDDLRVSTAETWAPLLEPYYLPCKSKRYFESLDQRRIITILRHILPLHGFRLQKFERIVQGRKRTVYQIHPATPQNIVLGEEIQVLFL
jgi:hypothetical protein